MKNDTSDSVKVAILGFVAFLPWIMFLCLFLAMLLLFGVWDVSMESQAFKDITFILSVVYTVVYWAGLIALIVHVAKNRGLEGGTKILWIASMLMCLAPFTMPLYWHKHIWGPWKLNRTMRSL